MRDTENVRDRLYRECVRLMGTLDQNEELGLRDRLAIVAGVRSVMVGLGLLKSADEGDAAAGSAVRKYSQAFTGTARQRTAKSRRIAAVRDNDGSDDVA